MPLDLNVFGLECPRTSMTGELIAAVLDCLSTYLHLDLNFSPTLNASLDWNAPGYQYIVLRPPMDLNASERMPLSLNAPGHAYLLNSMHVGLMPLDVNASGLECILT